MIKPADWEAELFLQRVVDPSDNEWGERLFKENREYIAHLESRVEELLKKLVESCQCPSIEHVRNTYIGVPVYRCSTCDKEYFTRQK